MLIALPTYAEKLLTIIESSGHTAWVVGGFVRDSLHHLTPGDVDMASSATWQELEEICVAHNLRYHETGIKHGTLTVAIDGHAVEVTTYRTEGRYTDQRHPDHVTFVSTIEEDVARRDFTINAMAYHPQRGLIDRYDGQHDLERGVIECVGDAHQRFQEDPLRMLRALRMAATLGFRLSPATQNALYTHACCLSSVAPQRIEKEFRKLLCGAQAGLVIQEYIQVIAQFVPEAFRMYNFNQYNYHHIYDVLKHTTVAIDAAKATPLIRYAVFFHDIGKPDCFTLDDAGTGHFRGHPRVSREIADRVLDRLCISSQEKAIILELVLLHDEFVDTTEEDVIRMVAHLKDPEVFRMLLEVKRADIKAHASLCFNQLDDFDELERILDKVIAEGRPYSIAQLAVTGQDIKNAGITEGPLVGKILERLLELVISGEVPNEKAELEKIFKKV